MALWDLDNEAKRVLLRLHGTALPYGVDFSPDGSQVLVPVLDGTVRVVPINGSERTRVLRGHDREVWMARFSEDGTHAVSASEDGSARVWDLSTGTATVLPHPAPVYSAAFSPDGERVATAATDGLVRIWDADGQGEPRKISTGDEATWWVQFSGDGRRLVTAGDDGVVRVWDARGGPPLEQLTGHKGVVMQAAFVPGTNTIVSGGEDRTLRRWASSRAAALQAPTTGAGFSPDGGRVLSGSPNGELRVWDPETGAVDVLKGHSAQSSARYAADGTTALSASYDGTVRLWDLRTRRSSVLTSVDTELFTGALSPDGQRLAVAGARPEILLQDIDGDERKALRGHRAVVRDVDISPSGTQIASASDDGSVRLWDAATGKLERVLGGHGQSVNSVSYSADGRRLVSAGADSTARVWTLDGNGSVILRGHEGAVASADFDPSGRRVVTAGRDGTVRVWSANGGEALVLLFTHRAPALSAEFSPDGRRVLSAAEDSSLRITPCEVCGSLTSVLRLARTRLEHELTPAERQRFLLTDD